MHELVLFNLFEFIQILKISCLSSNRYNTLNADLSSWKDNEFIFFFVESRPRIVTRKKFDSNLERRFLREKILSGESIATDGRVFRRFYFLILFQLLTASR